jgi:HAD superfamily hydrolase (TIGR01490 family)
MKARPRARGARVDRVDRVAPVARLERAAHVERVQRVVRPGRADRVARAVQVARAQVGRPAAFFDVDHTLITGASMFELLAHEVATGRRGRDDHERTMRELRAMKAAGMPRAEVNRAYYRAHAGRAVAEVAAAGASWFAAACRDHGLFRPHVRDRLRAHAAAGHAVVLVSGSFPPCLDPIVAHVGADRLLCSRPEVRDGRYTGELAEPMIGERKAMAVCRAAVAGGFALDDSYAYGDHESDLPFLGVAGHPVVVGDDPVLGHHVRRRGGERLPW